MSVKMHQHNNTSLDEKQTPTKGFGVFRMLRKK
jgi:hypothetical protein